MPEPTSLTPAAPTAPSGPDADESAETLLASDGVSLVEDDIVIDEISIDGMCGVY